MLLRAQKLRTIETFTLRWSCGGRVVSTASKIHWGSYEPAHRSPSGSRVVVTTPDYDEPLGLLLWQSYV